jgi:hypothetical protein
VHFLSCEPLLAPLDIRPYIPNALWNDVASWKQPEVSWVICGGESGPNARPMHPDWARSLRDQCSQAGVPFFFKQWGLWQPVPWKLERGDGETDADYKARSNAGAASHAMRDDPLSFQQLNHAPWSIERALPAPGGWQGYRRNAKKDGPALLDGAAWQQFPGRELLSPAERKIIHHALGLPNAPKPYRNHYCAPSGGETREACERLADRGLLERGDIQERSQSRFFYVTDTGAAALGHTLPED